MCQIIFCILCLSFSETAVDDLLLKFYFWGFYNFVSNFFCSSVSLVYYLYLMQLIYKTELQNFRFIFSTIVGHSFYFCWLIFMHNFNLVLFACRKRKVTFVVFLVINIFVMVQFLILVMLIVEPLPCIQWCSQSLCHLCFTNIWTVFPQLKDFRRVQRLAKRRFP